MFWEKGTFQRRPLSLPLPVPTLLLKGLQALHGPGGLLQGVLEGHKGRVLLETPGGVYRGGGGLNIPVLVGQIFRDFIQDIPGLFQRELYGLRYPFLKIKR